MKPQKIEIGGKTFIQYWEDSEGRAPDMPPGTRVKFGDKLGTIRHQQLHSDAHEQFFGNVVFESDDGLLSIVNCWMCRKVDDNGVELTE